MKVLPAAITELYDAVELVVAEARQAVAVAVVVDELFVVVLLAVELACELVEVAADCVLVDDATEVELCDACEA